MLSLVQSRMLCLLMLAFVASGEVVRAEEGEKSLPSAENVALNFELNERGEEGMKFSKVSPSTFVVNQDRMIVFAKSSKTHGGRASAEEVLETLLEKK